MTAPSRPRVLCVDDEPAVLEGLTLHLRRRYEVATATSGAAALPLLADGRTAVVVSDMRMPGMDGATFLAKARAASPDTVRVLLTGQADLGSAINAVNEGQLFRFLTKPCPPPALLAVIEGAVRQYGLVTAERVLLEETLHGSVKALLDILALTSPAAFGRATRIKQLASALSTELGMNDRWQVEVAAMLAELGAVTLPAETVERLHQRVELTPAEQAMVARIPAMTDQLLGNIPRLEVVREIILAAGRHRHANPSTDPSKIFVEDAAEVLRVAVEFDALQSAGESGALAVDTLRGRAHHAAPVLAALTKLRGGAAPRHDVRELPLAAIRVGMVFAEDVRLASGPLLVTRGYEVTLGFVERAKNFRPGMVKEPVRVIVP